MSPLYIVGITLLTTVLADVSHVLEGQAHPPAENADPLEINNAFNGGNAKDFWWMQDDSPLKASVDSFKKCAGTGKCATGKHEVKFSSSSSSGSADGGPIDLQKNVFLNGDIASSGSSASFTENLSGLGSAFGTKAFHSGGNIDLSDNPFLQGGFAHAGQATSSGSLCTRNDHACVKKQDCLNGVVSSGATKSNNNKCTENEICCQLFSAGKSSLADHVNELIYTPGKSKFTGKDGLTPEQVQINHSGQEGIRHQLNFIGESEGSSTIKPVRDITAAASEPVFSSTPDYSNHNFGDDARFSNLDGLDYLPPHPSTPSTPRPTVRPSCPPGQYIGSFGRCEPVREPCPSGTRPTPSGGCEKLKIECPPGQRLGPYGGCVGIPPPPTQPPTRPPTPPPTQPACPSYQKPGPYGGCIDIQTPPPPPPQCPPGQRFGPYGGCVPIQTPPPPTQPPTRPPPPQCPSGQKPGPYGGCVPIQTPPPPTQPPTRPPPPQCPAGQKPGPYGGCVPIQTPPPPTQPPTRPPTTEKPYCSSGEREGPNGECISVKCGPNQIRGQLGCEDIPPPTQPPTRPPQPQCPPGQKPGPYGSCIPIQTPPPPTSPPQPPPTRPYCPSGQREGPNGQCVPVTPKCGFGQRPTSYGGCEPIPTQPPATTEKPYCPSGTREGPNGDCISTTCGPRQIQGPFGCQDLPPPTPPPTQPPQCPPGQKQGPYGGCVPIATPPPPTQPPTRPPPPQCPAGQKPGPYGGCVPIQTPPPPTQPPTRPPQPQCPPGQKQGPYGGCVPIVTPPPPTQPPTRPPPPQCPAGQKPGPYGGCVPIQTPPPPTQPPTARPAYCPSGQRQGPNGECISVTICGPRQRPTPFGGCENIPPPPTQPPTRPPTARCGPGEKVGPYGQCTPIQTPPTPTPTPGIYCNAGERVGPNGECIKVQTCPPGYTEGPFGTCKAPPPPPTQPPTRPPPPATCPPGQKPGPYGGCVTIRTPPPPTQPPTRPPIARCGPGEKVGPYGQCVPVQTPPTPTPTPGIYCNAGERVGPNGECIKVQTCPPGYTEGPFGTCKAPPPPTPPPTRPPTTCPTGQKPGPYGGCVTITTQPPPVQCPPGQKPASYGAGCVPVQPPPTPPPTCQPGYTLTYGQCVPIQTPAPPRPTPPYCASGQRVGPNGECVDVTTPQPCGPGQKLGPYGGCVDVVRPTPPPRPTCPPGSFPTAHGGCKRPTPPPTIPCPPGTVKSPSGRCETPPPPPRPITCPPGSYLGPSGNCVRPPPRPTPTTPRTYLPPESPSTGRPGYSYPTPTPDFNEGSSIESEYIPDKTGESQNNIPSYLRPTTERQEPSRTPFVPRPQPPSGGNNTFSDDLIPVGCAAALKCVQEIYCTADGFVSPVPVVLTKEQEYLRAPTTVCRDIESGTLGKCCRDRDYQDPWPSANLVNGEDNGQYAEDNSFGQYKADSNRITRSRGSKKARSKRAAEECGVRNLNSSPPGQIPIDANFAEISWQAMILRDSNRSLLCGGAIIRKNAVLTAAHCVEGLETSDILIKGGEWKLGIDEEPLPFQIVKVGAILRHPDFKAGSLLSDLAVLVLEENLRFTKNIGPICLPEPNLIPTQNCIATGWGKRILQLHARNALMHKIDVNIMEVPQCQQVMGEHFQNSLSNYNSNTLCGFSNIDQCKVDYGSALACADESGRYTLSGIYSWDTGCKQQGQIAGYVAPDVDWIENVVNMPLKQLKRLDRAYNTARLQQVA